MSTLRVTTIQDESGSNASTAQEINKGRAKAWVHFDGSFGTSPFTEANGGIRDSFNVSSVTDGGTGYYTVNFETAMPNANYCSVVSGTAGNTNAGYASHDSQSFGGGGTNLGTTSGFNIRTVDGTTQSPTDHPWVNAVVFN